jgi:polysaccharide deacetylase family protein (PEP-CTERM system associated)
MSSDRDIGSRPHLSPEGEVRLVRKTNAREKRTPGIASFTLDLEENRVAGSRSRVVENVTRILEFLECRGITATVFAVGSIVAEHPRLLREIASAGHEIGFHGEHHEPLYELSPREVCISGTEWRKRLEDLTGVSIPGYRAPYFSLTPAVPWASSAIADAGFVYSSSVIPAKNRLGGFPGAPTAPFRWPNGLPEMPCPVGVVGPLRVPFTGGVYARVLPVALIRAFAARQPPGSVPWIYCHPYDFDTDEEIRRVPRTRLGETRILFLNRKRMFDRLAMLMEGSNPRPLCNWATNADFVAGLRLFDPWRRSDA